MPSDFYIPKQDLHIIQDSLVTIWQKHIQSWNENKRTDVISRSNPRPPLQPDSNPQPGAKKGHVLKDILDGGVFCCKCGRQVKRTEHIRLKILRKPCTYPNLPIKLAFRTWCSALRLNDAEKHMNEVHNEGHHQLVPPRIMIPIVRPRI